MDIDYDEIARKEFTIHDKDGTLLGTYRLAKVNAKLQMRFPARIADAFAGVHGRPAKTDKEVQEWWQRWMGTDAGQDFALDIAFVPVDATPALSDLMEEHALPAESLAKLIYGMHSFFESVTGSSSAQPGTAKRSPKRAGSTRKAGQAMARPGKSRPATSRKTR